MSVRTMHAYVCMYLKLRFLALYSSLDKVGGSEVHLFHTGQIGCGGCIQHNVCIVCMNI